MCRTATNRKVFIDSVLKFVTKHNFDGIDIDWEYPNGKDDKFSFNNFLKVNFINKINYKKNKFFYN